MNPAVHGQWLFVEYEWTMRFGQGLRSRFSEMIELDLILRKMEQDRMRVGGPHHRDLRRADAQLLAISESWILLAHDLVRAARTDAMRRKQPIPARIRQLFTRLDPLRPMLAGRVESLAAPFWIGLAVGTDQTATAGFEHGLVPRAICESTGGLVWWPVAPGSAITVETRRRSLSDAFLSAFE